VADLLISADENGGCGEIPPVCHALGAPRVAVREGRSYITLLNLSRLLEGQQFVHLAWPAFTLGSSPPALPRRLGRLALNRRLPSPAKAGVVNGAACGIADPPLPLLPTQDPLRATVSRLSNGLEGSLGEERDICILCRNVVTGCLQKTTLRLGRSKEEPSLAW